MNKDYWNGIAENYESEIFSVLADDKENLVTKNIKNFGAKSKVAIDLGCGIGYFLPFLSKSFGKVHAVDFSEKCLQQARKNSENINGIDYWCEDMSSPKNLIPKADFILSINSVISQSITVRSGIFKSIYKLLKTGSMCSVMSSRLISFALSSCVISYILPPRDESKKSLPELSRPSSIISIF